MKCLPLPVRVAAGLAVAAVEEARKLPHQLTGLPVTLVSQALQLSMRVQQQITELAIKGDDALATLRPAKAVAEWATFDEDLASGRAASVDPWAVEEQALAAEHQEGEFDSAPGRTAAPRHAEPAAHEGPAALPGYAELTLPQVRGRLRQLSLPQLEELAAYERRHQARPQFVRMLDRRMATVRAQQS